MSLVHLALRARAEGLVVCTTGVMALAATTSGYTRASGSFVADGFAIGQEIVPASFATNTPRVVKAVSALTLTTTTTPSAESSAGGRSLSVTYPTARERDNVDFKPPTDGRGYAEEDFVPATRTLLTNAPSGLIIATGLYVVRLFAPANTGMLGLRAIADALVARFPANWASTLTDNTIVRTRPDTLPYAGQLINDVAGFARITVTIPWQHYSHVS